MNEQIIKLSDNAADRIKEMKNKREKTRAEKIAERLLYEKQKSVN